MFKAAAVFALFFRTAFAETIDCFAPCDGDVCTYNLRVNLFASELGYYTFDECGDITNPTIGVQVGKTYKFIQVRMCMSSWATTVLIHDDQSQLNYSVAFSG
jgi:hypothetical protein